MNVFLKTIRRLTGWCPNTKAFETGSQIAPANFEIYDKSGGEKAGNNLSRMKRIGLLLASVGALISMLSLTLDLKDGLLSLTVGVGMLLFLIGTAFYIKG